MTGHQEQIYQKYSSAFQGKSAVFDHEEAGRWGKKFKYHLRRWFPQALDSVILDLGCGGGYLLNLFKSKGFNCLKGIDRSPEQVELARQVVPDVVLGDALDFLQKHHNVFDLIAAIDLIEHFSKDEAFRFLNAAYAALKPGGRIILQTPNADSPRVNSVRYGDFTHEVCFTPETLSLLMALSGFLEIEMREQVPVPLGYSFISTIRWLLWQGMRLGIKLCNYIEIGCPGSGIFTRVFLISAIKPRITGIEKNHEDRDCGS